MMPPHPNAERDAQEAEFLLGNELLKHILQQLEEEAHDRALGAYAARDEDQARFAMHDVLSIRGIREQLYRRIGNRLKKPK